MGRFLKSVVALGDWIVDLMSTVGLAMDTGGRKKMPGLHYTRGYGGWLPGVHQPVAGRSHKCHMKLPLSSARSMLCLLGHHGVVMRLVQSWRGGLLSEIGTGGRI